MLVIIVLRSIPYERSEHWSVLHVMPVNDIIAGSCDFLAAVIGKKRARRIVATIRKAAQITKIILTLYNRIIDRCPFAIKPADCIRIFCGQLFKINRYQRIRLRVFRCVVGSWIRCRFCRYRFLGYCKFRKLVICALSFELIEIIIKNQISR